MDLEIAMIPIGEDKIAGFLAAMDEAGSPALLSCTGCHSVKVYAGVENPGRALVMVAWESVEAHAAAKGTPGFTAFIAAASPFFPKEGGGTMEHFRVR